MQTEEIDLGMNIDSNEQTGKFTIFYPQPFETSCLHPVVAWGNGTGVTGPTTYGFFNQNAASYGIVVIAAEDPDTGSGNYHVAGINYMTQQNADSSSKYYQKLDLKGVGVAGHSQGAIGATAGADKIANTAAEVCVAGGGTLPATVSFLGLTGTQDILESMTKSTFQSVPGPAFLADWDGGDHFTTETLAGFVAQNPGTIQMMGLYAAWFRCWLAGDQAACKVFQGAPTSCGACTNSGWATLAERNM
ncbi:MAG TPA: hypothetical protein VE995_05800 [Gaiellaceae bacterium]|nr:hypothetical protein [Gaiellaceae bacterium]